MCKYFYVKDKNKAITISYLLKEDFMTFNDYKYKGRKIYSFVRSERLNRVLKTLEEYK